MPTVLVVDDEPDFAWAVGASLEAEGYAVRTAENGREALSVLRSQLVHLVVCDIRMPIVDGIVLRKTVEDAGLGGIPFVFMSSLPRQTAERLLDAAHCFLQKPFSTDDLMSIVRQFVTPAK